MSKKYNIGFITKKRVGNTAIASCGCGTKVELQMGYRGIDSLSHECSSCGSTNFAKIKNKNGRVVYPYIEVLHKDGRGFKVKRINLSVFHDEKYNVLVKENMVTILIYNLINKEIKIHKNGKPTEFTEDSFRRFFTNVNDVEFMNMVSTQETEQLFNFAWSELSRKSYYGGRHFSKGLIELFNHGHMQILANAGFTNLKRFHGNGYYYNRSNPINKLGKSPKEILGIPKFALNYFKQEESAGTFELNQLNKALEKVDGNRIREIMSIVKDESTIKELFSCFDTLIEIHDKYGYNNIKKLTLYLFREIRMTQGIASANLGATLLRDYLNMSTKLGQEFEKYPKSLKKEHDIVQLNYRVQQDKMKKESFASMVSSDEYKMLEYKKKDYSIITPKEMEDLIKEGNELSHCVASYVESIINNRCKIFFLRNTKFIENPLATIEVRGGSIRQAKGYANRSISSDQKEFIKRWAMDKELVEAYY